MSLSPQTPARTHTHTQKHTMFLSVNPTVKLWVSNSTINVSVLYLQTDALRTVNYLEIEYLTKVNSEIRVQGAAVRSRNFFVVV